MAAGTAMAAPPGSDLDPQALELRRIEQQLDRSRSRETALAGEAEALAAETQALSQRLIGLAAQVQSLEARITGGEDRLARLDAEEAALRGRLARQRTALGELLAGLQQLERNPPPALAVKPDDAVAAVRGAMLFGAVVPELKLQAAALSRSLAELDAVRGRIVAERADVDESLARLDPTRGEIEALLTRKQALLDTAQSELAAEQARARDLAGRARSVQQLLDELAAARARTAAEAAAKLDAERQAEEARKAAERERLARPRTAFTKARGKLDYPAHGQRLRSFGGDDGFGGKSQGLYVATRPTAQVVAPADGKVEFAGTFRSYGQLLILDVGEGYHVLLAGLGTIAARTGQTVRAGEPIGTMGDSPARGTLIGDQIDDRRPILYVEFRKNGSAVDSAPWWQGAGGRSAGQDEPGGKRG